MRPAYEFLNSAPAASRHNDRATNGSAPAQTPPRAPAAFGGRWWRSLPLPGSWRARTRDWVRGSPTGLVALALAVGGGAGLGAVAFRYLILVFTHAFSGYADYSAHGRAGYGYGHLGFWFVVAAPVVGGLLYGPLIHLFAREARGHGVPEVMLAVAERGGRIRPQVSVVKALASALCIGSGGSVGREGPIVQIGSALGSTLGQLLRVPESRLRVLVACGAAGGISATFNAPIAGVFFALELILRDFEAESFGVVVLSSFAADIVGRAAFGDHPFLHLPTFQLVSPLEYLLYAGLGVAAAVVGVAFVRVLYGGEDLADRLWRGPEWLRPAVGGILLGLLLLALPELYGVGYPPLEKAIHGGWAVWFLVALLAGKILATTLTISIGGSGGVFAPSLFMGAMLGSAYGHGVHHLFPHSTAAAGAYGLVGMGAVFAGAARAPITAVIIVFELTGEYRIILPLMFAIVLAAGVSRQLSRDTIYTLKLRRRGIDLMRGRGANLMALLTVRDAMQPVPVSVDQGTPLNEVIERLMRGPADGLPVVDADGAYRGTVTSQQVEQAMRENALDADAGGLAQETTALRPSQTLEQGLSALMRERSGLPVLEPETRRVVGWLTHMDVLRAYNQRLEAGIRDAERRRAPQQPRHEIGLVGSALARLRGYRVVELELGETAGPVGSRLAELGLPEGSSVLGLRRNGDAIAPTGTTELAGGDRLTLLVPAAHADRLVDTLEGGAGSG
ncbi:MAG TPA: chloride channel protein [Gaiellaceae bacterium]|nr:chloride channel protein [Gaiellaceae bacterium]